MGIEDVIKQLNELAIGFGILSTRVEGLTARVDGFKELTDAVMNLAYSVRDLTNEQKYTKDEVVRLRVDMDAIQKRPSKFKDVAITAFITTVVSIIVTYIVTKL